jgi:hypothetical protein
MRSGYAAFATGQAGGVKRAAWPPAALEPVQRNNLRIPFLQGRKALHAGPATSTSGREDVEARTAARGHADHHTPSRWHQPWPIEPEHFTVDDQGKVTQMFLTNSASTRAMSSSFVGDLHQASRRAGDARSCLDAEWSSTVSERPRAATRPSCSRFAELMREPARCVPGCSPRPDSPTDASGRPNPMSTVSMTSPPTRRDSAEHRGPTQGRLRASARQV